MRILGIDPGLDITGYGVIDDKGGNPVLIEAGIIRSSSKDPFTDRLHSIYYQIDDLIKQAKPDLCAIEQLYSHYKHPMTAILMGHARGVVLLCCRNSNIEIVGYPAKTVKRAVTGNGNASKMQVKRVVQGYFNIKDNENPVDVTDALALGLTHIYHAKLDKELVRA
ncbi:crossover junction endodeoxyribonuclease RuvC [Candidatus Omnitrophota bacterium]